MKQFIGPHIQKLGCRFCGGHLKKVLKFGNVPLAGGFFEPSASVDEVQHEEFFPLNFSVCVECKLAQVDTCVDADMMFKKGYFYFSSVSKMLSDHFVSFAETLSTHFPPSMDVLAVEMGCNDGVFLRPLAEKGFRVVGVDPATNVVAQLVREGFDIFNDYFCESTALSIVSKHGRADIFLSSNSFAHIDDMNEILRGVAAVLKPTGVLIFEVHYLEAVVRGMQYDMIYHEHASYYSIVALEPFLANFGFVIYNVEFHDIHAGSIRVFCQRAARSVQPVSRSVHEAKNKEIEWGFDKIETFQTFAAAVDQTRQDLLALLRSAKKSGAKVYGYGASGRAVCIMSYCGLTRELLDGIIDDSPRKIGAITPFNHIRIEDPNSVLYGDSPPTYVLLFAWAYIREISSKHQKYLNNGGKWIVPLPKAFHMGFLRVLSLIVAVCCFAVVVYDYGAYLYCLKDFGT